MVSSREWILVSVFELVGNLFQGYVIGGFGEKTKSFLQFLYIL